MGTEHRPHAPVDVRDIDVEALRRKRSARLVRIWHEKRGIERLGQQVLRSALRQKMRTIGTLNAAAIFDLRRCEQRRKVDQTRLPAVRMPVLAQAFDMAHHVLDGPEPELGHDAAKLLGHHRHETHNVLGAPLEPIAKNAVLRGDAHGARVLLAVALHQTAHRHKRHGRKPELLGSKQAGNGNIAAVHEFAISLEHHP